jgi:MerR HTH family regulatory protein
MTNTKLRELVLSGPETAEALELSPWTLDKYRQRGLLVPITDSKSGRALVYSREEVEKFKRKRDEAENFRPKPGPRRKGPWVRPWKKGKGASV